MSNRREGGWVELMRGGHSQYIPEENEKSVRKRLKSHGKSTKGYPPYLSANFITHITNRVNEFLRKAFIDFIAQIPDIDIHHIGERVVVIAPDLFQNHGSAQGAIRMGHEIFQQGEFFGCQRNGLSSSSDFACSFIQVQILDLEGDGNFLVRPTAEERLDPGE